MYHIDQHALRFLAQLRGELAWLETEHPDKTALLELARARLREHEQLTRCQTITLFSAYDEFSRD